MASRFSLARRKSSGDVVNGRSQALALMRLVSPRIAESDSADNPVEQQQGVSGLEDWQDVLLKYADSVPPLAAATRYYAASAQRVSYRVVGLDGQEAPGEAGQIASILNANRDAMSRGVSLLFLVGDTRALFNTTTMMLDMMSPGELYARGSGFVRVDPGTGRAEPIDSTTQAAWRSYEPSLRVSYEASSSNKALLDVFEAYRIAYGEERALSIRSAMNAGVTLVSEDIFGAASSGEFDANGQEGFDPADALERRFLQMLSRTIRNPRNSASFAPPVLSVPGGVSDKIAHVSLAEKRDTRMLERRLKALREEIAIGIDLPSDVAAGFFADMNHWNGFIVNESAITNHIAPKVGQIASDAFREIGFALGIDTAGFEIDVDYSELLLQADVSERAIDAHDRLLISDRAAREALGFTEDDAPSEEDPSSAITVEAPETPSEPAPAEAGMSTRIGRDVQRAAVQGGLTGRDAAEALDEINRAMSIARARLQRDVQKEIVHMFSIEQRESFAAFDPVQTIVDNIARVIRKAYETMSIGAARGIATQNAKDWYNRTRSAIDANAERAAQHARTVVTNQVKVVGPDGTISSGFARALTVSVESVAAGKSASVDTDGRPNGTRPNIISEQDDWVKLLNDEFEGDVDVEYTWSHGGAADPFPPHLELDGVSWRVEDEREVLDNPESFPLSSVYHPGDHLGCTCEYDAAMIVVE